MKYTIALFLYLIPSLVFCQDLTEDQIPFALNSDTDSEINVIDMDDDNDGVQDNLDVQPLNAAVNAPTILSDTIKASDDAGLRNNTNAASNENYGADAVIQTKNELRSFAVKIPVPANLDLNSATFIFYSDSENDGLAVYYLPVNTWSETDVTYNTMDFSGKQLLGITGSPVDGQYSFDLPMSIIPAGGGDITLWLYDAADPNNNTENLYTKEFLGDLPEDQLGDQAPAIIFNSNEVQTPRLIADVSAGKNEYVTDGEFTIGLQLSQEPTDVVYVPVAVSSDPTADIDGDEYLVFDDTNWNVSQFISVDPVAIGDFTFNLRPLHSNDAFFNGHNPLDLEDYKVQATDITNLAGWTVATGSTFDIVLTPTSAVASSVFTYQITDGPSGLNVTEFGGSVSFSPLNFQVGTHDVTIKVTDDMGNESILMTTITVTDGGATDPVGFIVDLAASDNVNADGSGSQPYNDVADAVAAAVAAGGGDVLLRGGEFEITSVIFITDAATESGPVTIKPLNGEAVKINFGIRAAFQFTETSKYITLEGLEIDGGTDATDFWCIVGQAVWGDGSVPRGGGLCVIANGEDITIKDCYLHDAYQKGVEITGRYINIEGCIMRSIATTSISGGHGIMRQQQGREFFDADEANKYRWDINSNMLFNIEQRIYSWVPSKGFMEMVIDEGKPILIDDPKDTDGIADVMTARITNNVVAFGAVDHIRLKSTPGLEVSNNSVFSETLNGDGITDKVGDTITPQFTEFIFANNVAQTNPGTTTALEIDTAIDQDTDDDGIPPLVSGNYALGGSIKPDPYTGLTEVSSSVTDLYLDPKNGNFRLDPSLGLPSTLGVSTATLDDLDLKAEKFGIQIKWDGWITDNLKLSQSILDNMPGVRDGIAGNDTVMVEGSCEIDPTRHDIDCDVRSGTYWKNKYNVGNHMQFRLNPLYTDWYLSVDTVYTGYERIRWGCSYLKQDQVFENDWLTHSQITVDTNTVIYGPDNALTLDGDILIDFEDFTPALGDFFDLMIANTITSANTTDLFDEVIFEGYTPDTFTLEIVTIDEGQALRLTIVDETACDLLVVNTDDSGVGSLRDAIACAVDGDVITLSTTLSNSTIVLTSTKLIIDKSITIVGDGLSITLENAVAGQSLDVAAGKSVTLNNFTLASDNFANFGLLICNDMTFKAKTAGMQINFENEENSDLNIMNNVEIK